METFEQLIDFLHTKGFEINSKSPYELDTEKSFENNNNRLNRLTERQKDFNSIMHELTVINGIINKQKNNEQDSALSVQDYFKRIICQIINNKITFNHHHPLYGYKPFNDLLMVHYINNEQYEDCIKLNKTIHRESYVS